ncbi:MAG: type IX secretion system membrane protein PorP/SprF [Bacteroidales bacterium]|nr:type IX secretion system membrane protein PorP/SprF [Bacteroidales bacterium]
MKKIYLLLLLIILFARVFSQQQPLYSQYMLNEFLLNPAIAGTDITSPVRLTFRQQWVGIKDAPSTQAISGHTLLKGGENIGAGGFIYHDKFGPVSQTGIHGAFSYHLKLSANTNLSFGLSMSAFQYAINESNLNIINPNDPAITGTSETVWVPDANFGLYLNNSHFYAGLSSTQLIQKQFNMNEYNLGSMVRHYYFTVGYKWALGENYLLTPSVLLKSTDFTPVQLDINARIDYKNYIWLAFSYRHKDASVAMIGLKKERFQFGYAFDYTLSGLASYSHGSHEIMIGYELIKPIIQKPLL